jgi:ubiquitin-activating enzyme E1
VNKKRSLGDCLEKPGSFELEDFSKFGSSQQLHLGFRALNKFHQKHSFLPEIGNNQNVKEVIEFAKELNKTSSEAVEEVDEALISLLAKISRGNLNPMAAFIGGVIAQEALKSTGKFSPINQWYYFDCREALPNNFENLDRKPINSRYDGQLAVFGKEMQKQIEDLNLFLGKSVSFISFFIFIFIPNHPSKK